MSQPGALLEEILSRVKALPEAKQQALVKEVSEATKHLRWTPNPGPQTDAYFSKADVLLFGGEPGGGKSQLILGLAFNCHDSALVMRRRYTDLDALTEEAIKINGTRDGFSGKPPPTLRHGSGKIDFGAAANIGDEQAWMGRAHDFLGLDEAAQFAEKQIRFLRGWVRTTKKGQRTRTVLATNPPLTADGLWLIKMFAPWLDPKYPRPAEPGELRWAVVDDDDVDHWVGGPGEYEVKGGIREAESRTFIPSKLEDNPELAATDYRKRIDSLPAEIRKILLGGFRAQFQDDPWQVYPTDWITAAQERWKPRPPPGIPMVAIACDPASGGPDRTTLCGRHDWWFSEIVAVPGAATPLGRDVAGLIVANRRDQAKIVVDMGGGYGGAVVECLLDNVDKADLVPYLGAASSVARSKDGKLGFVNKRAEAHWKFREALDPSQPGGSPIQLPPDPELLQELTAVSFQVTPAGVKITPKDAPGDADSVKKRLGRSPDKGDAVVMAWSAGDQFIPQGRPYNVKRGKVPNVNLGPRRKR